MEYCNECKRYTLEHSYDNENHEGSYEFWECTNCNNNERRDIESYEINIIID